MYTLTTEGYVKTLLRCYDVKQSLMVYGGFGIGKSMIPRQVFAELAEKKKKQFVFWEDTTVEEKNEMIANPEKYFVFCDQRIGQMDSTDLRGIPNMMDTEKLQTIPYSWVVYFTQKDADGVIFFDEINLAPPTVAGSAYQIINDRTISDRRLGKDVFVMGAGNRAGDNAHTYEMPSPLHDRFAECEINVDVDKWTEWAYGKINPHLIAFIQWKQSRLYYVPENKNEKASTPRAIERASRLLGNDINIESAEAFEIVSISCGESFASEFGAYTKYYSQLNWTTIYKNPKSVENFELDKLWAVAGGMSEQFIKGVDDDKFQKMMDVSIHMKPDYALVSLKMMKDGNNKQFKKQIKSCKNFQSIVCKHAKFIID